jgi:RNA polymerase sigma factor (sigma-70 family)
MTDMAKTDGSARCNERAGWSDAELLAGWAAGCRDSANVLVERHLDAVHRFFRNKVNPVHVEDLVQQTFLAGLEGHASYRHEAHFKYFLLGIARNQLYSFFRRAHRDFDLDFRVASVRDLGTSPTGVLAKHAQANALLEALRSLPLEHQITLELSYWEGLSGAELAGVLGVPLNTGYARLHRAKAALRAALHARRPDLCAAHDTIERLDAWAAQLRGHCG